MDEDDRRVIGFQRQRLIVGFERRHIEKIREAPGLFIVRDDCPKGMFMESLTPRPELENTHRAGQKGGPGRPNIKPSGMEQASEPKFPGSSGNQRRGRGSTRSKLSVHEERTVKVAAPPRGSLPGSKATRASWCRIW